MRTARSWTGTRSSRCARNSARRFSPTPAARSPKHLAFQAVESRHCDSSRAACHRDVGKRTLDDYNHPPDIPAALEARVSRQPRSMLQPGRQVTLPGVRIRFPSVAKDGHWRAPVPQEEGCDKSRRTLKLYELAPLAISCRSMASSRESALPPTRSDSRVRRTFSAKTSADALSVARESSDSRGATNLQSA